MQGLGTTGTPGGYPPTQLWCGVAFYGTAINDLGQLVGYTQAYAGEYQSPFTWTRSSGVELFGDDWPPTHANGISNTRQIVGDDSVDHFHLYGYGHAVAWKDGFMTDLGVLDEQTDPDYWGYTSNANRVKDLGQIVGWSSTSPWWYNAIPTPIHAVLWSNTGAIRDLGTLPGDTYRVAVKINLFGQVVGTSGPTVGLGIRETTAVGRPFIWSQRSGMQDLNSLINRNSGWVLNSAADINIWGQIVGQGTRNGQPHGFLLTPRTFFQF